jgi:fructoselysine 3-epimerase
MPFKYAFNTWCYGSFPVWVPAYPLDEVIRRLARIGYDGIEIGCAAPHAWPAHLDKARRQALRELMNAEGLKCSSLLPAPGGGPGNNPASPLAEERKATIAHYKEVVDLARDLGSDKVLYIAGWRIFGTEQAQAWDWSLTALREIAEHAADRGVTIAIEPTSADSNLVDTGGEALQLREQSGKNNVGVMFDTYHALYRNEPSSDYVYEMAPHLAHVHFADTDRLPPGEGAVDWYSVMQALKDTNFDGYVTMEIGFNTRRAEPDRYARSALTFLKGLEQSLS